MSVTEGVTIHRPTPMGANGEAVVCSRTSKKKLALELNCIFKNATMPSDLIQVALIYQESFDLQRALQFWLYGF